MELDGLLILIVLGAALWNARSLLEALDKEISRHLHHSHHSAIASDNNIRDPVAAREVGKGLPPAPRVADALDDAVARRLDDVRLADPSFDAHWFCNSARLVYETILAAFAHGDREVLGELLAPDVFETFEQDIAGREARREHVELTIIRLTRADIVDAGVFNGAVQIVVAFESELVMATRGPSGAVVAGDPAQVFIASDLWTFAKGTATGSPVWRLVATEASNHNHQEREMPRSPASSIGAA